MNNTLILDCVYTKFVRDGNFKKLMFKQLRFSHLSLITIRWNCLLLTNLGKNTHSYSSLQVFFLNLKSLFWNHIWNGEKLILTDKTKFSCKDKNKLLKLVLKNWLWHLLITLLRFGASHLDNLFKLVMNVFCLYLTKQTRVCI